MEGRLDTPLLEKPKPESPVPDWIEDMKRCTKVGQGCHLKDSCLSCPFNPEVEKNYIKFTIPNRYKSCFKKEYPKECCKNCSGEDDCKLLDENKELWQ